MTSLIDDDNHDWVYHDRDHAFPCKKLSKHLMKMVKFEEDGAALQQLVFASQL